MKQGDIVLVPFPFTDLSAAKTRPALVLSKTSLNEDFILSGITSRYHREAVEINNNSLIYGQLPCTSYIRYSKVVTLNKSIVRKVVAKLNVATLHEVIERFKSQF